MEHLFIPSTEVYPPTLQGIIPGAGDTAVNPVFLRELADPYRVVPVSPLMVSIWKTNDFFAFEASTFCTITLMCLVFWILDVF